MDILRKALGKWKELLKGLSYLKKKTFLNLVIICWAFATYKLSARHRDIVLSLKIWQGVQVS
jgi:hypothetical protein